MKENDDIIVDGTSMGECKSVEFDCKSIDITFATGGGYFTSLPISPLSYRQVNKDGLSAKNVKGSVSSDDVFTHFRINDDWGGLHVISISNKFSKEIKKAIKAGKKEKILN